MSSALFPTNVRSLSMDSKAAMSPDRMFSLSVVTELGHSRGLWTTSFSNGLMDNPGISNFMARWRCRVAAGRGARSQRHAHLRLRTPSRLRPVELFGRVYPSQQSRNELRLPRVRNVGLIRQ